MNDEKGKTVGYVDDLPSENETQRGEVQHYEKNELRRSLKSRHIQLIALGGCIGTGLFIGSGQMLANSGPASVFLSYVIMSIVIYNMVNIMGEMACWRPLAGTSPTQFVRDYADRSLGFATGWCYWYAYAFLVPSELVAAALCMGYWTDINSGVWIAVFLVIVFLLNVLLVAIFGEVEFWFASIKIIAILILIITSLVIMLGGAPDHDRRGFRYWKHDAFKNYLPEGQISAGARLSGFWYSVIKSGFSFITSPELLSITAGEAQRPRANLAKATRRFIYRLCAFYLISTLLLGCIVSSSDKRLMSNAGGSDASASPFVIGIMRSGIKVLDHFMNAFILTSALSAGNAFLYSGSRTMYALAKMNEAPKVFQYCTKGGIPIWAVLTTATPSLLAFLTVSSASATVFNWFVNLSTIAGFIGWIMVMIAYIRFRAKLIDLDILDTRPFKTPFQPYLTYVTLATVLLFTITNGFAVFITGNWSASDFVAAYITLPLFLILYVGHKLWVVRRWRFVKPLEELDVTTGLDKCERIENMWGERIPKNFVQRLWFWIA